MRFLLLPIVLLSFLASAQETPKQAPVLFTINNSQTLADEFVYLYNKNNQSVEATETDIREYMELFINFKLKVNEAHSRGMDTSPAFKEEFQTYQAELLKPYLAEEDELNRLVEQAYKRLMEEVHASHILIALSPEAGPQDTLRAYEQIMTIKERAENGEDFGLLASQFSDDPSAKSNTGDLGYFTGLQMVYPFENAAYNLAIGQISEPVRTQFGYHLIKVHDQRPANGEVEISHIFVRTEGENASSAGQKILEAFDQLKLGIEWVEVCTEFSDDAGTKDSGGRLRPFGIGAFASVPEFEQRAFSLTDPGQITEPFQSSIGWHIIRLEKRIPVPTFDALKSSLQRRVSNDDRLSFAKERNIENLKQKLGFKEVISKSNVFLMTDSSLVQGNWHFDGSDEETQRTMFKFGGLETELGEFFSFIEREQAPSALGQMNYFSQLYHNFIALKANEAIHQNLLREDQEYRNLLNEYREGILLFNIMEEEVWGKASEDSVGQFNFYNDNLSHYEVGDRLEARILTAESMEELNRVLEQVRLGEALTEADYGKLKMVHGWRLFEKGESEIIDSAGWSVGLHQLDMDGIFYLVEVKRLVLPGAKTFEEARASIISDYQDFLEKQWLDDLKKKYRVKMNPKGERFVLKELARQ